MSTGWLDPERLCFEDTHHRLGLPITTTYHGFDDLAHAVLCTYAEMQQRFDQDFDRYRSPL